jgi:hypothetical protein
MLRVKGKSMEAKDSAMPGYLPLAANTSVLLEPRACGVLKVGAGAVSMNERVLTRGARLRLWAGERVEMTNIVDRTSMYAWDLCHRQPPLRFRIWSAARRLWRAVSSDRMQQIRECSRGLWCVSP